MRQNIVYAHDERPQRNVTRTSSKPTSRDNSATRQGGISCQGQPKEHSNAMRLIRQRLLDTCQRSPTHARAKPSQFVSDDTKAPKVGVRKRRSLEVSGIACVGCGGVPRGSPVTLPSLVWAPRKLHTTAWEGHKASVGNRRSVD